MLTLAIALTIAEFNKAVETYYQRLDELHRWHEIWFHDEIEAQNQSIDAANKEIYRLQDILGAYDF